jgi:hypothetical protein
VEPAAGGVALGDGGVHQPTDPGWLVAGSAGSTAFAAPAVLMAVVMTVLLQALRLASGTVVL